MHTKTLLELSHALHTRELSSVELTRYFLDRIARYDNQLNSFITVTEELALSQAAAADVQLQAENAGQLCGIPLAHKDIFCTLGVKTSCGSRMLDNFIAPYNATVVEKIRDAGMVTLGKTNMDEFAMGSSNETSYYGAVKNPWDIQAVPGGSSGGSAAALAARLAPIATGTDTGGRNRYGRLNSATCGIMRFNRTQANLRISLTLWHDRLCVQSRSRRAHCPQC